MSRVLVIYTGGTFGMQASTEGLQPSAGIGERLKRVTAELDDLPDYEVEELDHLIDSSNLRPADWQVMAARLMARWEAFDGFVLIHGTDTMAYSASALSFLLAGINKPVILTGSQIPLGQVRNDATANFVASLQWAADKRISEVCIAFGNRLLRGNRARKLASMAFTAFDSPNLPHLGTVGIRRELLNETLLTPDEPAFVAPDFEPLAVAQLLLYPGIGASQVKAILDEPRLKAVVLLSYGAGNPPDADAELMAVLEAAISRGVVIVNVTQCLTGGVAQGAYASAAKLNQMGVIPGADMTAESAFAKLHCLLAQGVEGEALKALMQQSLAGELTLKH